MTPGAPIEALALIFFGMARAVVQE